MTETTTAPGVISGALSAIPDDLRSPKAVATKLGVAPSSLYGWLGRRLIRHTRLGRLIRVRESDVAAFLEANAVVAPEGARLKPYGSYPPA